MPKSKNKKDHKKRLANYKANKKKEQDSFKKKMIEQYMKMQQQAVADKEAHTSTEEVSGPEIDLDGLNEVENWQPNVIDVDVNSFSDLIEPILEKQEESKTENIITDTDDNNNK